MALSMNIRGLLIGLLTFCSFLPLMVSAQKAAVLPQDTIARIGENVITARDLLLRLELMPFPGRQSKADAETVKTRTLYAMLAEKVLAHEASRLGLGEDTKTLLMKRELENLFIRDELYKREIVASAKPTTYEVRVGMDRFVHEIRALSFLVRSNGEGKEVGRRLRLCRPDSVLQSIPATAYVQADSILVRFGGVDTAYENAAYNIGPSRVSPPFLSANVGWAVLYLLDRRTYKPAVELALPDRRRRVEQILQGRHEQERIAEYTLDVLKARRATADPALFHLLADSISALWQEDTSHFWSHGAYTLTGDLVDLVMERLRSSLKSKFVSIDDGDLSLGEVLEMFRSVDFRSKALEGDPFKLELNAAIKDLVAKELLAREGRRQGLHYTRDVQNDLRVWIDYWGARELYYRVRDTIAADDEDVVGYLIRNKQYFGGYYEVNIREILTTTVREMGDILEKIQRGQSIASLAKQYSKREVWAKNGGESGFFRVSENPELGFQAMTADTGRLVGPLKLKEGYSLFTVIAKRQTAQAKVGFDTLKTNVTKRLLGEKRRETLNSLVAGLAREQGVVIDQRKLREIEYSQIPVFTRRLIGFGGRMAAFPLLMQMWDWVKEFQQPPTIFP